MLSIAASASTSVNSSAHPEDEVVKYGILLRVLKEKLGHVTPTRLHMSVYKIVEESLLDSLKVGMIKLFDDGVLSATQTLVEPIVQENVRKIIVHEHHKDFTSSSTVAQLAA